MARDPIKVAATTPPKQPPSRASPLLQVPLRRLFHVPQYKLRFEFVPGFNHRLVPLEDFFDEYVTVKLCGYLK